MVKTVKNHFQTVSGLDIECDITETENLVEIIIKNCQYLEQKKRQFKRIGIETICYAAMSYFLFKYSIFTILSAFYFISILIEIYILLNLIEFGE